SISPELGGNLNALQCLYHSILESKGYLSSAAVTAGIANRNARCGGNSGEGQVIRDSVLDFIVSV
ncbi:MAG: hypothetical protein IJT51_05220, partial [Bacteroidales bacterium]|nr:hypothetical protein [Bacteroidales bacterium]